MGVHILYSNNFGFTIASFLYCCLLLNYREQCEQPWRSAGILIGWIVSSVIASVCTKEFLEYGELIQPKDIVTFLPFGLAIMTTLTCIVIFKVDAKRFEKSLGEVLGITLCAHLGTTLMLNMCLLYGLKESTSSLGLLEPIVAVILTRVCLGSNIALMSYCSLPLIIIGAIGIYGFPSFTTASTSAAISALLYAMMMTIRNIAISHIHSEGGIVTLRTKMAVAVSITIGVFSIVIAVYMNSMSYSLIWGCYAVLFHVISTYLSAGIILKQCSVTTFTLLDIWKLVLVKMICSIDPVFPHGGLTVLFILIHVTGLFCFMTTRSARNSSEQTGIVVLCLLLMLCLHIMGFIYSLCW